jgi:plastocyanin
LSGNNLRLAFFAIATAAILCAGCVSNNPANSSPSALPSASPSGTLSAGVASVSISNFAFSPVELAIKRGATVTWTNADSVAHTVTSDTGAFDSGALEPGSTFIFTFSMPGTYSYHCSIHPMMTAKIIVQ